jgi:hypothetical protein
VREFFAAKYGPPSLTPGIYIRSLLIRYFEGIAAERGIAWRLADSLRACLSNTKSAVSTTRVVVAED